MKPEDYIGAPCDCPECRQAGISEQVIRRDPQSGRWLHGYPLRRWYEAREAARQAWPAAVKRLAMPS